MTVDAMEKSEYGGTPQRLFLFTMGVAQRFAYAQSTQGANYNGDDYLPMSIDLDNISQALAEDSPTNNIRINTDAAVCGQFIAYQPVEPMRVRVYRHHLTDPDGQYVVEYIGEVISSALDEKTGESVLLTRMVSSKIDRRIPWPVYQKPCNHALYTVGCGANPEEFRTDTTAATVVQDEITSPAFSAFPDGWFKSGYLVTDNNESRFIIYHEGATVIVQTPFVSLQVNDEISAYAGCDRSRQMCTDKFDNYRHWLGFGWIPDKNPFVDTVWGTGTASRSVSSNASSRNTGLMRTGG